MAWVEFRMTILGEQQVARAFQAAAHDADDLSAPLAEIGEAVRLSVSEQMRTEGAHGLGHRWTPLNTSYAAWKRQQVGDEPMLVFSGAMRDSLISRSAITVTPQRMTYRPTGKHSDVAAWHQAGSGELPARKVVSITAAEKRQFERSFLEWLRRDPLLPFT